MCLRTIIFWVAWSILYQLKCEQMNREQMTLVMIPQEEWEQLNTIQAEILERLKGLTPSKPVTIQADHITAKEFMDAVRIKRTKFDQLVQSGRIKIVKKMRKIYVPAKEVQRYFNDPSIR